jgi:hypothetical protein
VGLERGLGSSLPPTEPQRDSGVFAEMKRLFSIAPKDGKGGEVTGETLDGCWSRERQTLTSASGVLSVEARVGERALDVVVLKRQTLGVSVCCEWRQQLHKSR